MANTNVQNELLTVVQSGSTEDLLRLRVQMEQLTNAAIQQVQSEKDNTNAIVQNTVAQSKSAASTAGSVAKSVTSALGIGTFLSPLITGITKLFGGGGSQPALPELVPIQRPASISLDAAVGPSGTAGFTTVDYSQDGSPRRVAPKQQVTIQIQALDSQSLLDRSDDLARAVRQAMLESSRLNDVIAEI